MIVREVDLFNERLRSGIEKELELFDKIERIKSKQLLDYFCVKFKKIEDKIYIFKSYLGKVLDNDMSVNTFRRQNASTKICAYKSLIKKIHKLHKNKIIFGNLNNNILEVTEDFSEIGLLDYSRANLN